ncbi:MAG: rhodanese-like domain-containing protein [Saprospiraceae bacterium]|nr:rhodanese-like domain-containing protein [Saprospiraceae bacterium]
MNFNEVYQNQDLKIIDVRESFEYSMGHVGGAFHFPLSRFGEYMSRLEEMTGPKVFYCQSGNRSGQAVAFLKSKGFKDVYNGVNASEVKTHLAKAA